MGDSGTSADGAYRRTVYGIRQKRGAESLFGKRTNISAPGNKNADTKQMICHRQGDFSLEITDQVLAKWIKRGNRLSKTQELNAGLQDAPIKMMRTDIETRI